MILKNHLQIEGKPQYQFILAFAPILAKTHLFGNGFTLRKSKKTQYFKISKR